MLAAGAGNFAGFGDGAGHDFLGRLLERFALELDRHGGDAAEDETIDGGVDGARGSTRLGLNRPCRHEQA